MDLHDQRILLAGIVVRRIEQPALHVEAVVAVHSIDSVFPHAGLAPSFRWVICCDRSSGPAQISGACSKDSRTKASASRSRVRRQLFTSTRR